MHDLVAKTYLLRKRLAARSEYFADRENTGYENDEELLNHVFADADSMKEILSDANETRRLILRNVDINDTSTHRGAVPLLKYMDETITDARELLTLIAEAQNRMITHLRIQESRRSIQEAAFVKRLTQLAFIFIPLSYVSSLFGMNISELNGAGPKLWKSLTTTSFCILLGALAFWDLATRIQGRWALRMEERKPHEGSWRKVCGIVYAGVRTGHFWWMVWSGVLVGLVTANRFGDAKDTVEKCEGRFYRAWSEEKWSRQTEKFNLERERRER